MRERDRLPSQRPVESEPGTQRPEAAQFAVGNQSLARLLGPRPQLRSWPVIARKAPKKAAPPPDRVTQLAEQVKRQVELGRFIDPEQKVPDGYYGPPAPGGAFWLLNGLNETELNDVLKKVGAETRAKLFEHIGETAGKFDTPRLQAALRAASEGERNAGVAGIGLLDAIRNAGTGSFAAVWALLSGKSRPEVIDTLRVLPRDVLSTLQGKLSDAPAAEQAMFGEVITDLLGSGTNMSAEDVIDVEKLKGLDRTMAQIYNERGLLLMEQAQGLNIKTAAAAGIMKVESGGETFSKDTDKSITRFENHVLWDRWGKTTANKATFNQHFKFGGDGLKRFQGHKFRASATGAWEEFHGNQAKEREVLDFAVGLAGDVAYECASFGAGQIMGFNFATVGFTSAKEMVTQYDRSERSQVTGIFEFIRTNNLADAVRAGDYKAVARRYNGSGQVDTYAALMESAANSYAKVSKGKKNVIE